MKILAVAVQVKATELVKMIEDYQQVETGFGQKLAMEEILYDIATLHAYTKRLKSVVRKFKGVDAELPDDITDIDLEIHDVTKDTNE